jgi:hypothetical protein
MTFCFGDQRWQWRGIGEERSQEVMECQIDVGIRERKYKWDIILSFR